MVSVKSSWFDSTEMSALDLWFIRFQFRFQKKAVLTLVSVTLGHSDDIDHLVLGEHLADGHLLLKVLTGKVDLNVFD